jgi:nucleoside-diphosphate-sugar epimerase
MPSVRPFRITPGMLLRMLADVALIQLALIAAYSLRLFYLVVIEDAPTVSELSKISLAYFGSYCNITWRLTPICLIFFYWFGFYTYGRYYQGRYKALIIFQAVTISYMALVFSVLFFSNYAFAYTHDPNRVWFPRGAIAMAWFFSVILHVGARIWSQLWQKMVHPEREALARIREGVQRRVLVIGGAGYIGSALLPKLLDEGHHVRLLDVLLFGEGPIEKFAGHPNLQIIRGDFRHVESVVEAMRNVESVIHLGAIVGDPACSLDEDLSIDVNLSATRMVAELAKASGVDRFIFASTCSVYGACDEMLDEHSEVNPVSLYGRTKLAAEQVLLSMADDRFSPTIVRFATIYGLSGRTRFDLVVNLLAAKAKIDGEITVFGGSQWRPFIHVDDAARAVAMILDAPREVAANQIFNVGANEQNYTIHQIAEKVHSAVVSAKMTISQDNTDQRDYRVDFSKIRNLLGFQPEWTVEEGIRQVLEAIAAGDVTDYRDSRYSNVKFLSEAGTTGLARDHWARQLIRDLSRQ